MITISVCNQSTHHALTTDGSSLPLLHWRHHFAWKNATLARVCGGENGQNAAFLYCLLVGALSYRTKRARDHSLAGADDWSLRNANVFRINKSGITLETLAHRCWLLDTIIRTVFKALHCPIIRSLQATYVDEIRLLAGWLAGWLTGVRGLSEPIDSVPAGSLTSGTSPGCVCGAKLCRWLENVH